MAQKIELPDIGVVNLDWATDETMKEILAALKGTSPAGKKKQKETEEAAKGMKRLSDITKKTKDNFKKVSDNAADAAKSLDGIEDSASSVTSGLLKVVGGLGAMGTALGFAAGTLDAFIDAQVSAIQSGFSFSDQLIETRAELANIGLNFTQFSTILASQGEVIRQLGDTGSEAAERFSDMIMSARDATKSMGFYGLTSEEIANEMADLTGILIQAGTAGDNLFGNAVDSFELLNKEVLGYARLTGRQRRELMRNQGAVSADAMFISTMGELGDKAVTSALNMTNAMTGAFDDSAPELIEMVKRMVIKAQKGIILNPDDITALNTFGFADLFDQYSVDFAKNANDPAAMNKITQEFVANLSQRFQDMEAETLNKLVLFSSGQGHPLQEQARLFLEATTNNRVAAENLNDADKSHSAFIDGITETTKELLDFKAELQVFIQNVRSGILALFGVEDFGALANIDLEQMGHDIHEFVEAVLNWKEDFFGPDGVDPEWFIAGLLAAWVAPAVIGAIGGAFAAAFASRAVISAISASFAAGGAGAGLGGKGGKGGLLKKLGLLAMIPILGGGAKQTEGAQSTHSDATAQAEKLALEGKFDEAAKVFQDLPKGMVPPGGLVKSPAQSEYWENWKKNQSTKTQGFDAMNALEQQKLRMQTPRGYLDNMRETSNLDAETHAILTGRTFERMEEYMRRQAEETARLRRIMEENQ